MTEVGHLFDTALGAYLDGPALVGVLVLLGLFVGFLTGLFGVGGGFLITPMLNVAFGIPYPIAIGSDLSYTIGSGASGMQRHIRLGNFEPRSMLILAACSMIGAFLGGYLNDDLREALGQRRYRLIMHGLFILMLVSTAWLIGRSKPPHRSRKSLLQRLPIPPYINLPTAGLERVSVPGICAIGLLVGVMKGMMGIGGGVFFMPLLILVVGLTPHQAVGTSLGVVVFSSIAGAIKYGLKGNVNLLIVMSLLVSSVFGIQLGAWVCDRMQARRLRQWFAVLVVLVAAVVAARLVYEWFFYGKTV